MFDPQSDIEEIVCDGLEEGNMNSDVAQEAALRARKKEGMRARTSYRSAFNPSFPILSSAETRRSRLIKKL